ncbi:MULTISPECIES: hypothetical protein [Meridianimarinicoccus]|uniref:Uncharacterized protein n=1 Tax=Meridianimarinicoccus marinus TaxID=3231483 RepID=A0ABV3L220_9RHOB|nr:hypothetical protein [Fluviibacterium sp. MJW13]
MRLVKIISVLLLLAVLGLVGFAYLGDLSPAQTETRIPVDLNAQ